MTKLTNYCKIGGLGDILIERQEKVLKQSTDRSQSINKVDILSPSSVTNAQKTTAEKTSVQQILLLQITGVSDLNWYCLKACRQSKNLQSGHTDTRTHKDINAHCKEDLY